MTGYVVNIGGVEYDVDAPDQDAAVKAAHDFAQQELNAKAKEEYASASEIAKPFMAAQDVARTVADTASLGFADKAADYFKPPIPGQPTQSQITKAIRSRMTGADVLGDVGVTMAAAPTTVPKMVGMLGGGPVARAITGGVTAGAEGGVLGGLSAAGHDQPVGEGVVKGGVAGVGGQTLSGLLTKPVNAVANWWSGANKALPPITQSQLRQASRMVGDDPATKAFSAVGDFMDKNTLIAALGHFPTGVGMKFGGMASNFIANQGRREKVDTMRRMVGGQPRVHGPLSDEEKLALGLRGQFYDYLNE
jgi:hypothetical protein